MAKKHVPANSGFVQHFSSNNRKTDFFQLPLKKASPADLLQSGVLQSRKSAHFCTAEKKKT